MKQLLLFLLLLSIRSFSQDDDSLIESININDTIKKDYSSFFKNNPSKESIKTVNQYFNSFRFFDCLRSSAPIENTKFNFSNVQHLKIIDNYAQTIYHAEFDKEGRYKKLSYIEPYAGSYVLNFNYTTPDKFVVITKNTDGKDELFMEIYAKQDTIITRFGDLPGIQIFKDEFDNYKTSYFSETQGVFKLSEAKFLDLAKRKCQTKNCVYSTLEKNTYRYDYTKDFDGTNGYEILYYNENNNLTKVEFFIPNLTKSSHTITYEYFSN